MACGGTKRPTCVPHEPTRSAPRPLPPPAQSADDSPWSHERGPGPRSLDGVSSPLRSDWAFWVAFGLAAANLVAATIRYDGPWTSADVLTAIVFIPVTWFVSAALVGIPIGIVRGFRQGFREGRPKAKDSEL